MSQLNNITDSFDPIRLEDMDRVNFMNRKDYKFLLNSGQLHEVLREVSNRYFILEIKGRRIGNYQTKYYDTEDLEFYTKHHNKQLNRFKIRKRSYEDSNLCFFEVKHKNNKKRTIKKRIKTDIDENVLTPEELEFVDGFNITEKELSISTINRFNRITLVNKNYNERCTIDLNLKFDDLDFDNVVIIEIKQDGHLSDSPIRDALQARKIKSSSFSKYCAGIFYTREDVKKNLFKEKIRFIKKLRG